MGFGTSPADSAVAAVASPSWPVAAAVSSALLSVAAILLSAGNLLVAATGYVAGALLTPAFTVLFRFARRRAAQSPFFIPRPGQQRVVLATLVLGIAAGMVNAWFVATELAKR